MSFIARQPNGLLCRFSTIIDCVTDTDMTEDDYVELCAEKAREEARENLKRRGFVRPFEEVLESTLPNNINQREFEAFCRGVGYTGEIPKLED